MKSKLEATKSQLQKIKIAIARYNVIFMIWSFKNHNCKIKMYTFKIESRPIGSKVAMDTL